MNDKLNIQNLISLLIQKHDISPANAEEFVKAFFALVEEGLERDKYVKIKGLGTFKLIEVSSRSSVDVNTGERIEIQGHTKITFTPETALKEIINRPFGHFETVVLNDSTILDDTLIEGDNDAETGLDTSPDSDNPFIAAPTDSVEGVEPAQEKEEEHPLPEESSLPEGGEEVAASILSSASSGKRTSLMNRFVMFAIGIALGCLAAIVLVYWPNKRSDIDSKHIQDSKKTEEVYVDLDKDSVTETAQVMREEIAEEQHALPKQLSSSDTISENTKSAAGHIATSPAPSTSTKKQEVIPDSTSFRIVGLKISYTVKEGETLTRISLKFYGTKTLWPYIVKYNADILKNPDNINPGTVIRIPELIRKK